MDILKGLFTSCTYCFWLAILDGVATIEDTDTTNVGRRYGCRRLLVEISRDSESKLENIHVETTEIDGLDICEVSVRTSHHFRIRAEINFIRNTQQTADCEAAFMTVANDRYGAYVQSMTSYRLCNQSETEIVSRGTSMWFVLGSMREQNAYGHVLLEVQKKVSCRDTEFRCSPVQCVPWSRVCDGAPDCQNGRDEYCVNATKSEEGLCFRCRSGSCIRPTLPRYHDDWGKPLWFLCDNIRHCKDGTDERFDVCYRHDGRQDKVIACRPVEEPGATQLLWRRGIECNGVLDCQGGEDEENCNPQTVTETSLDATPILIVSVAGCIVLAGAFIIHRQFGKQEKKCLDTSSDTNTSSSDDMNTTCQRPRVRQSKFNKHQLSNIKEETECFISTV